MHRLWSSFALATAASRRVYFAGDSGYAAPLFQEVGRRCGPFDAVLLPIGAYEPRDFMRHHHVDPAEAVEIFEALRPQRALGMHWGTFQLTFEPIDEPRRRLRALARDRGIADRFVALEAGGAMDVPPVRDQAGPIRNAQNLLPSGSRK